MTRVVSGVVAVIIVGCLGLPVLLASTGLGGAAGGCVTALVATPSQPVEGVPGFDAEQVGIAATIVDVGVTKGAPRWGWVIAIATAMQESWLRNLPNLGATNDHDSIGVFQQRPSQGWGTPEQLANPAYQAGKFYDKLLTIPGWQNMPLAQAAQAVQVSAYPNAYTQWTDAAVDLVNRLASTDPLCVTETLTALPDGFILPATTPPAVATAIVWALGQLGTPYSFGGDCSAPHSGDPARQCDCSSLIILSPRLVQGCDLRESVEDTVADMAAADTVTPGSVDAIVAELQSHSPSCLPAGVCGVECAGVPR